MYCIGDLEMIFLVFWKENHFVKGLIPRKGELKRAPLKGIAVKLRANVL
jgi:hypothetical protein